MKHGDRKSGSDRFVARFAPVTSLIQRVFRRPCPACGALVSMNCLAQTGYARGIKLPWIECRHCSARLRVSRRWMYTKFFAVIGPVFLLSAILGSEVFSHFELTSVYRERRGGGYEANFLGFLLTIFLVVFPLTTAAQRVFRIEVIK